MSRVSLAFACFFRLLFRGTLPPAAAKYLPAGALPEGEPGREAPEQKALPAQGKERPAEKAEQERERPAEKPREKAAEKEREKAPAPEKKPEPAAERPRASAAQHHRDGALALLALLQREGRLVDFLTEAIDEAPDATIGAAVREVHRGCRKVLDQYLAMEPVMPGEEGDRTMVPKGFDPAEVRLIGEAKGEPPFRGTLVHHGWRVVDAKLPVLAEGVDRAVVAPAEVELSA